MTVETEREMGKPGKMRVNRETVTGWLGLHYVNVGSYVDMCVPFSAGPEMARKLALWVTGNWVTY